MLRGLRSYFTLEHVRAWMPIIVVLLTTVMSGYLIPKITANWQDHQKALEIKTSLVEAINDEILQILLAMQLSQRGALQQKDFDEAYRRWEVKRAVLAGKLRAYFREQDIALEFERLSEAVTDLYVLGGVSDAEYRSKQIEKLRGYFGNEATDWTKLADLDLRRTNFFDWFFAWWDLRQASLVRKDAVIQHLLSTPVVFLES
jgi:hypothetical protein